MKFLMIFVLGAAMSSSGAIAKPAEQAKPVEDFTKEAMGLGFEEVDETCGDCLPPDYLLGKYTKLRKTLTAEQRTHLRAEFVKIIEGQRIILTTPNPKHKNAPGYSQRVNAVIDAYLKQVDAVKP